VGGGTTGPLPPAPLELDVTAPLLVLEVPPPPPELDVLGPPLLELPLPAPVPVAACLAVEWHPTAAKSTATLAQVTERVHPIRR
jgi:hypothetical protein